MLVKERVRKHRVDRQLQGFVRLEVVVPAESVEKVRKLAYRLRTQKAKLDLSKERTPGEVPRESSVIKFDVSRSSGD